MHDGSCQLWPTCRWNLPPQPTETRLSWGSLQGVEDSKHVRSVPLAPVNTQNDEKGSGSIRSAAVISSTVSMRSLDRFRSSGLHTSRRLTWSDNASMRLSYMSARVSRPE